MIQYDRLSVRLSNSQLNKLKSATKYITRITLRLSSNMIDNTNDEPNSSHNLLLTNTYVSNLLKVFTNNLSANFKSFNFKKSKIIQLCGYLGRFLESLLKTGLPLMKNVLKLLPKSILTQFSLTAMKSAVDARIQTNK